MRSYFLLRYKINESATDISGQSIDLYSTFKGKNLEPILLDQAELNGHFRDLSIAKEKAEFLTSRLK